MNFWWIFAKSRRYFWQNVMLVRNFYKMIEQIFGKFAQKCCKIGFLR